MDFFKHEKSSARVSVFILLLAIVFALCFLGLGLTLRAGIFDRNGEDIYDYDVPTGFTGTVVEISTIAQLNGTAAAPGTVYTGGEQTGVTGAVNVANVRTAMGTTPGAGQNYYFVLVDNTDNAGAHPTTFDLSSFTNWTPIPTLAAGNTFDGDGHTIDKLTMTGTTAHGFFSNMLGTVKNLSFTNVNISGAAATAGVLAATVANGASAVNATIENVGIISGTFAGGASTGALVATVGAGNSVNSGANATKLVIDHCYNLVPVSGVSTANTGVGGLVGTAQNCELDITCSFVSTTLVTTASANQATRAGGLLGMATGTNLLIDTCYNSSNVTWTGNGNSSNYVGGLIGYITGGSTTLNDVVYRGTMTQGGSTTWSATVHNAPAVPNLKMTNVTYLTQTNTTGTISQNSQSTAANQQTIDNQIEDMLVVIYNRDVSTFAAPPTPWVGYTFSTPATGRYADNNQPFVFTVTLDPAYNQTPPTVKINNILSSDYFSPNSGLGVTVLQQGDVYNYTILNLEEDIAITVAATLNTYTVTAMPGSGLSVPDDFSFSGISSTQVVAAGTVMNFSVTLNSIYDLYEPVVRAGNNALTATGHSGLVYNYSFTPTQNTAITVDLILSGGFVVTRPASGTGWVTQSNDPNAIATGGTYTFMVNVSDNYYGYTGAWRAPVVTITWAGNPTPQTLQPIAGTDETSGSYYYEITNIQANVTINIANMTLNTYDVTLPASGTGFTATRTSPGTAGPYTAGTTYNFTVNVDVAYRGSAPLVRILGGATLVPTALSEPLLGLYYYTFTVSQPSTISISTSTAIWTVNFYLNDGTATVFAAQQVPGDDVAVLPATSPQRAGYTFGGWFTADGTSGWGSQWNFATPLSANLDLYARWNVNPVFTVNMLPNGTYGTEYSQPITATCQDVGTIIYTLQSGILPTGLSIVGDTIIGTPAASNSFSFTIRATNQATGAYTDQQFAVTISGYMITFGPDIAVTVDGTPIASGAAVRLGGAVAYSYTGTLLPGQQINWTVTGLTAGLAMGNVNISVSLDFVNLTITFGANISVEVNSVTVSSGDSVQYGDTVSYSYTGSVPQGRQVNWSVTGLTSGAVVGNVTITASVDLIDYTITFGANISVEVGSTAVSSGDLVHYGDIVSYSYIGTVAAGKQVNWSVTGLTSGAVVGNVTITASVDFIDYTLTFDDNIEVTVNSAVVASGAIIHYGDTVDYNYTGSLSAGEYVNWTVTGLTLGQVTDNVTISASIVLVSYTISFGENILVTVNDIIVSSGATVQPGDAVAYSYTGNIPPGKQVYWTVTGLASGEVVDDVSISAIVDFINLTITFDYNVTATVNSIPVISGTIIHYGDTVSYNYTGSVPQGKELTWSVTGLTAGTVVGTVTISAIVDFINYTITFGDYITATVDSIPVTSGTIIHYGDTVTYAYDAPVPPGKEVNWTVTNLIADLVAGNVTIAASVDFINYTITFGNYIDVTLNGSPVSSGEVVHYGDAVTYSYTGSVPSGKEVNWTVTNLTADLVIGNVVISASVDFIDYIISFGPGIMVEVNSNSVLSGAAVHYGDAVTYTYTGVMPAGKGVNWTVTGLTSGAVRGDVTIIASVDFINYTLTFGDYIDVTVNGNPVSSGTTVYYGDAVTYTYTGSVPAGNEVRWSVTGLSSGAVVGDVSIFASADNIIYTVTFADADPYLTVKVNNVTAANQSSVLYGDTISYAYSGTLAPGKMLVWDISGIGGTPSATASGSGMAVDNVFISYSIVDIQYALEFNSSDINLTAAVNGTTAHQGDPVIYGDIITYNYVGLVPPGKQVVWTTSGLSGAALTGISGSGTATGNVFVSYSLENIIYSITFNSADSSLSVLLKGSAATNLSPVIYGDAVTYQYTGTVPAGKKVVWDISGLAGAASMGTFGSGTATGNVTIAYSLVNIDYTVTFDDADASLLVTVRGLAAANLAPAIYGDTVTYEYTGIIPAGKKIMWTISGLAGASLTDASGSGTVTGNVFVSYSLVNIDYTVTFNDADAGLFVTIRGSAAANLAPAIYGDTVTYEYVGAVPPGKQVVWTISGLTGATLTGESGSGIVRGDVSIAYTLENINYNIYFEDSDINLTVTVNGSAVSNLGLIIYGDTVTYSYNKDLLKTDKKVVWTISGLSGAASTGTSGSGTATGNVFISYSVADSDGQCALSIADWVYNSTPSTPNADNSYDTNAQVLSIYYKTYEAGDENSGADDTGWTLYNAISGFPNLAVGRYIAKVTFGETENYIAQTAFAEFTVTAGAATITANNQSVTYNAAPQEYTDYTTSPSTLKVTVEYYSDIARTQAISAPTSAGTYYVTVTCTDPNYTADDAYATYTIETTEIPGVEVTGVDDGVYDGTTSYGVTVTGADGYSVTYSVDGGEYVTDAPLFINAGDYEVDVRIEAEGYATTDYVVYVKIAKAIYDMSGVGIKDLTVDYDGLVHSIAITGALPDGVSVTYTSTGNNRNAGVYIVTAVFSVADPSNYSTPQSITAKLIITSAHLALTTDWLIIVIVSSAILLSILIVWIVLLKRKRDEEEEREKRQREENFANNKK